MIRPKMPRRLRAFLPQLAGARAQARCQSNDVDATLTTSRYELRAECLGSSGRLVDAAGDGLR